MQKISLLTTLFFICSLTAFAQINDGSMPKSFTPAFYLNKNIPLVTMPALDMATINHENTERDAKGVLMFNTKIQSTSIALGAQGVWDKYPNGDRIWRTRIQAKDAKGMVLYFSNFRIPQGAKLYVYSIDKKEVLGGFTSTNNQVSGKFALGPIHSDDVIVEYLEPSNVAGQGQFTIDGIGNMYRFAKSADNFGDSDPCEVNVNCTPEGNGKIQQRDAVARILVRVGSNAGWCSGAMVNNALQNCDRYFLTALHCALGTQGVNSSIASASDFGQWIFYFNYQASGCTSPSSQGTLANQSLTGCTMRAHSNGGGGNNGSDFLLLEINNAIPSSYNVFFAGWNAGTAATTGGYGIHHPAGDIKKVSTFSATTATTGWNGSGLNSHWGLSWIATTNGHGVTEGGSSGSPLFNSAGLIVGTLTGGSSFCTSPNSPDAYGKMSYHWTSNGAAANRQLKVWLDPNNSGITTLAGTYFPCTPVNSLDAGISNITNPADSTTICDDPFAPEVVLENFGTTTLTSATINYQVNSGTINTFSWTGSLATGATQTVTLPTVAIPAGGAVFTFRAFTSNPNGGTDGNTANDETSVVSQYRTSSALPYAEAFGGGALPTDIIILDQNGDGNEWGHNTTVNGFGAAAGTGCMAMDNFAANFAGQYDWFFVPTLDLTGQTGTSLTFDVAYARYDATYSDTLIVAINSDCGTSYTPVYFKGGSDLATAPDATTIFTPTAAQWRTETVDLSAYDGASHVRVAFLNLSGYGQRMFVDNINIQAGTVANGLDAGISSITNPVDSTTICDDPFVPEVVLENFGTTTLTSVTINYQVNTGTIGTFAWTGSLAAGATETVSLPLVNIPAGGAIFTFRAFTSNPNAGTDADPNNDETSVVSQYRATSALPYAEAFGGGAVPTDIILLDQNGDGNVWDYDNSVNGFGTAVDVGCMHMDNFTANFAGQYDWFFVPTLDLTGQTGTSLTFDVAYARYDATYSDTLIVAINSDCGTSYTPVYLKGGSDLATAPDVTSVFVPTAAQWRTETVDLSAYDGASHVRVAFLNLSGYGQHVYVDNINIQAAVSCNLTGAIAATTDVSCHGGNDGGVTVTASGGTPAYSYNIGAGSQASGTFAGLSQGTYTITITDNASCSATVGVSIGEPAALTASLSSSSDVACFGGATGMAEISTVGGTPVYSYNIGSGSQVSGLFSGLVANNYTVTVIDGNNCTTTVPVTITEPTSALTGAVSNTTDPTCNGSSDGSITVGGTGGTAPYNYNIGSGNQFTGSFTALSSGTYTVSITDGNNCTTTTTATLTNPSLISSNVSVSSNYNGAQISCNGASDGEITATATGGTGALTYAWSNGQTGSVASNLSANAYTVTITDANGCSTDVAVIVSEPTALVATATVNNAVSCNGGTDGIASVTTTGGTGATTAIWSDGQVGVTATGLAANAYTVSITDANGCNTSTSVTMTEPTTALSGTVVDNGDGSATAAGTGGTAGYTYQWDAAANNQTTATATGLVNNGTYDVTITDANGCTTVASVTINIVGLNQISNLSTFDVIPNPNAGTFQVQVSFTEAKTATVRLTNVLGQVLREYTYSDASFSIPVELTNQASGVYFVVLQTGTQHTTKKVVVTK
ncbi:T9SS type A sorting domain-containing protein [Aureispira sp. CCB-QB1]|uniref:T9SS type A sorting domain-containing protein n=1 Tax=Aureispira sp. CCB-QB1 TaxID=1313421 RepID=UPI000696DA82|nr:T9SS type A sorting domain-containing protein [Aureispira sp. CCB-QB1]